MADKSKMKCNVPRREVQGGKKFVESDTRKVAKLKRESANIDKAMAAARKKNKGK